MGEIFFIISDGVLAMMLGIGAVFKDDNEERPVPGYIDRLKVAGCKRVF